MTQDIQYLIIAASVVLSVSAVVMLVLRLFIMTSDRGTDNMDPPPGIFMPVMGLVRLIALLGTSNFPDKWLAGAEEMLQKNGCSFMLTAEEYWAGRIVFALLFGGIALMSPSEGATATLVMGVAAAVGFMLPQFWIIDYKRRRGEELVRNLPLYLEYLTMCVDAGLNFSGALKQAVDKGPHGAMRNEFRVILRDINSGYSRAEALNRFDDRVEISDISTFVRAVVQADKLGSSLKDTLYAQAQQRLNERFQRAEKLAMEAPVKLIVPLVIFIFPLTFIILLFPIVMKFMADGAF